MSVLITAIACSVCLAAPPEEKFLARVNGTTMTVADLEFLARTRQVAATDRIKETPRLIDEWIERQLIREFLTRRKITAPADELEFQIRQAEKIIREQGEDPGVLLPRLGYTAERMRSELGLPLAWQVYARQTITLPQTRAYFEKHQAELDGTRVRARQIFLKLLPGASEAQIQEKTRQLAELRSQILGKSIGFEVAARMHSEAPTREMGGDLGIVSFRGKLPTSVARAAFQLKAGEISEPVVSSFGVHLIQVTERIPGDLSLEDVRPQIFEILSTALWNETLQRERESARIER